MNYYWIFLVSAFSLVIPLAATVLRLRRLHKRYLSFALLLLVGLVNEGISYAMIEQYRNNLVNSNIYTLIEFVLLASLFFSINSKRIVWLWAAISSGIAGWALDNLVLHSLWHDNTMFRILSSFVIVWLSMDKINQLLLSGRPDPFKKTDLVLCIGFIVYYVYRTFIHIFNLFPTGLSTSFHTRLWLILSVINMLTHLIFTIGILWMPKRQEYTLR